MSDLTPDDQSALAALLRETIAADRLPLSPRVRHWQAINDKLEPSAPKPAPLPPLKPPGEPSMVLPGCAGRSAGGVSGQSTGYRGNSMTQHVLAPAFALIGW